MKYYFLVLKKISSYTSPSLINSFSETVRSLRSQQLKMSVFQLLSYMRVFVSFSVCCYLFSYDLSSFSLYL